MTEVTLQLELNPSSIYFCVDGKGWGSQGEVYEDGGVHNLTYAELRKLGNGKHIVQVDAKARANEGTIPQRTDDERRVAHLRLNLFLERCGFIPSS
jgi:hypothetical protein